MSKSTSTCARTRRRHHHSWPWRLGSFSSVGLNIFASQPSKSFVTNIDDAVVRLSRLTVWLTGFSLVGIPRFLTTITSKMRTIWRWKVTRTETDRRRFGYARGRNSTLIGLAVGERAGLLLSFTGVLLHGHTYTYDRQFPKRPSSPPISHLEHQRSPENKNHEVFFVIRVMFWL